ncbi:MAG: hypothetical protein MJY93_09275 [Fibrobacter sp.]|nr:hypothetical protein [Fibrobacter sp.]
MNFKKALPVAIFGIAISSTFIACGDGDFVTTEVPSVGSVKDLGTCGKKNRGEIIVVEKDDVAYECVDGEWKRIDEDEDEDEDENSSSSTISPFSSSKTSAKSSSSKKTDSSSSSDDEDESSSSSEELESSSSEEPDSSSDAEEDSSSSFEEPESSSSVELPECGSEIYNPVIEECIDGAVVKNELVGTCGPTSTKYDVMKNLCAGDGNIYKKDEGYEVCLANGVIGDAYKPTESFCNGLDAIPLCNGSEYNVLSEECLNDLIVATENIGTCGLQGVKYDKTIQFCSSYSLYDLCDGETYTPRSGYCENGTYYYSNANGAYFQDLRDKQTYKYVKIGNTYWMAKNLNYYDENNSQIANNSICAKAEGEEQASCEREGRLYSWDAAVVETVQDTLNHQGLCPEGWRIPAYSDFIAAKQALLETYESDPEATYAAQATGYAAWPEATNNSGLGLQHTPYYKKARNTYTSSDYAYYLTTTKSSYIVVAAVGPKSFGGELHTMSISKTGNLVPVRCVKDSE